MRRRRQLSGEEKRLWFTIARTAKPLKGKTLAEPPALPVPPVVEAAEAATGSAGAPSRTALAEAGRRPGGEAYRLHPIERPVRRKIGRGRIAIEDRIDLHGRTESVAHYALLGFLRQAQARGMRHVLVITGRGASHGSSGALKRAFPHWLATLDFRMLVAGYEPAERGHGGEGAFYVRIRRR